MAWTRFTLMAILSTQACSSARRKRCPTKPPSKTYYIRQDGKGKAGETRNYDHRKQDAPQNEECTNRPWLAISFVLDSERFTVVYLDHPDNPKPAYYSERDYGRFGSYFVADVTPRQNR